MKTKIKSVTESYLVLTNQRQIVCALFLTGALKLVQNIVQCTTFDISNCENYPLLFAFSVFARIVNDNLHYM